jgi:hypothetical protein
MVLKTENFCKKFNFALNWVQITYFIWQLVKLKTKIEWRSEYRTGPVVKWAFVVSREYECVCIHQNLNAIAKLVCYKNHEMCLKWVYLYLKIKIAVKLQQNVLDI